MISAVTGSVVALAATSAQVTLSAPIFTAPTQPVTDVGVVLQRTVILANVGMLPIYVLWWNIEAVVRPPCHPAESATGMRCFASIPEPRAGPFCTLADARFGAAAESSLGSKELYAAHDVCHGAYRPRLSEARTLVRTQSLTSTVIPSPPLLPARLHRHGGR